MSPSYWKRLKEKRIELSRKGVEARERKRLDQVREAREVGRVTFSGTMFGGEHNIRCLDSGDETRLWIEIDGQAHRTRTWRGVMKMVCKRMVKR